jgi:hypothetical protein
MTTVWIAFTVGLILGANFGIFIMALLVAARERR